MADEDPRIPQVHTCYKCLLQGKEPDVYIKLENLTLFMKPFISSLRWLQQR